jgi:hypothetical protein
VTHGALARAVRAPCASLPALQLGVLVEADVQPGLGVRGEAGQGLQLTYAQQDRVVGVRSRGVGVQAQGGGVRLRLQALGLGPRP